MSDDQLDLDAIEARANAPFDAGRWPTATANVVVRSAKADVPALVAEVRRLWAENHRLATLLGRRMTGPEIGAAIAYGIETGAIEIPPEGSPMLSGDEVARAIGLDIV